MYRLYVDEVGGDSLTHVVKEKHRYLSLSGVATTRENNRDHIAPEIEQIKCDVFYHDPDIPINLHRKDIMGFKGPFEALRDEGVRLEFDARILRLMADAEYTLITALIDKQWMLRQRHWRKTHPYHYLMEILIEKYTQFLERKGAIGDVMPEGRRGKQDKNLQEAFELVRSQGTYYVDAQRMQSAIPSKKLKFRYKSDNIAGLQLCDLLAHPSHIFVRECMGHEVKLGPFAERVVKIIVQQKYDRSSQGKIMGYGIKHYPN